MGRERRRREQEKEREKKRKEEEEIREQKRKEEAEARRKAEELKRLKEAESAAKKAREEAIRKKNEEAAAKRAEEERAAEAAEKAKQELAKKMADSAAGKRNEEYAKKKAEVLITLAQKNTDLSIKTQDAKIEENKKVLNEIRVSSYNEKKTDGNKINHEKEAVLNINQTKDNVVVENKSINGDEKIIYEKFTIDQDENNIRKLREQYKREKESKEAVIRVRAEEKQDIDFDK